MRKASLSKRVQASAHHADNFAAKRDCRSAVLAVAVIGFDVKHLQYPLIIAVTIMAYCWYSGADKTDAVDVPSDFSKKRNKDKPRHKPVQAPAAAKADETSGVSKDSNNKSRCRRTTSRDEIQ
jgi:hypothetical protein